MKTVHGILVLAAALMLAGCASSHSDIAKLSRAAPAGSPYTRYLAAEYLRFADILQGGTRFTLNSSDASHFARKGLAAADGLLVTPEIIEDWDLDSESFAEAAAARAELVTALENGAGDIAPYQAAVAQSRFDCWIAQQEGARRATAPCKDQFRAAMNEIASVISGVAGPSETTPPPPPAAESGFPSPVAEAAKGEIVPVQQAAFMVFFDWDKYDLSGSALQVLDAVAGEIKGRQDVKQIVVVGHTDTSGPEKYNRKLSLKRANAVRDAIVSRDIPAQKIKVDGRGESELLVQTPDNVRQPENRRAQITLE